MVWRGGTARLSVGKEVTSAKIVLVIVMVIVIVTVEVIVQRKRGAGCVIKHVPMHVGFSLVRKPTC